MGSILYSAWEKDLKIFLHELLDNVKDGPVEDLRALVSLHAAMIGLAQTRDYG